MLEGAQSQYAGLAFLVQALEWLAIRETLADHPPLRARHLPIHILWQCAERLGIPREDPICEFLPEPPPLKVEPFINFTAPAAWQDYCWPPTSDESVLAVRRVRGFPHQRLLFDSTGSILVACWKPPMPAAVREWTQGYRLQQLPPVPPLGALERIVSGYISALDHFLVRYTQMGLRPLVTRPGLVAATRTHLDVTFDQTRLEIGIRKAGLDINPGWVPWLGRVIYFHYPASEEIIDV